MVMRPYVQPLRHVRLSSTAVCRTRARSGACGCRPPFYGPGWGSGSASCCARRDRGCAPMWEQACGTWVACRKSLRSLPLLPSWLPGARWRFARVSGACAADLSTCLTPAGLGGCQSRDREDNRDCPVSEVRCTSQRAVLVPGEGADVGMPGASYGGGTRPGTSRAGELGDQSRRRDGRVSLALPSSRGGSVAPSLLERLGRALCRVAMRITEGVVCENG